MIGIANPWMVVDCPLKLAPVSVPAVSMPTTLPAALTSGPPESPETMSAFIWIMPVRLSELPPSLAVMDWSRSATVPDTTAGVPPLPYALPMATTSAPMVRLSELPSGATLRLSPEMSLIFIRATSSTGS